MALLIGYLNSLSLLPTALWVAVIFVSVLIHELGHALTAIFFGQKPKITLMALGGVTQRQGASKSALQEFLIVLNGPMAGFLLCFAFYVLLKSINSSSMPYLAYIAEIGTFVNLIWTLINLAPVYPLDGGHLMMIACRALFGFKGVRLGYLFSMLLSIAIAVFFFFMQAILAGSIFLLFAYESYRAYANNRFSTLSDEDSLLKSELEQVAVSIETSQWDQAREQLKSILSKTDRGLIYNDAIFYQAQVEEHQGNSQKAYELLNNIRDKLSLEQLFFLQKLAYQTTHFEEAISIGNALHQEMPLPEIALINALSHAEKGEAKQSVGWIETAMREGIDSQDLLKQPGFDHIRTSDEFKRLGAKIQG